MTNIKLDEGDGKDDGGYGDERLLAEDRKDDERVVGEGAPPSKDGVTGDSGQECSEASTSKNEVMLQTDEAQEPCRKFGGI